MLACWLIPESQDFSIFLFPDSLVWSPRPLGMFSLGARLTLLRSEFSSIPSGWNVVLSVGGGSREHGSRLHP